jgi:tripartite ATP-independent transporter DctP family solute receptor
MILTACGGSKAEGESDNKDSGEDIVIKVGHIAPDEHSYTKGLEEFAKRVEEKTDGQVTFDMYGNGQLGGEREVIEQVQLGSLDMTMVTAGPLTNFVPEFAVLEMPFLFRDIDHVYATLDGDIGEELTDLIDAQGFKTLGLWENGLRHLTNDKKALKKPDDAKGLKFRTIENDLYIDSYKALGIDPTPIAFPEVYTSLQQGVIDGLDASYGVFHSTKLYEVQDQLSEVGMHYAAAPIFMNQAVFESYPEDVQDVLIETGEEMTAVQREINQDMEAEQKQDLIEKGVNIVEKNDVDMKAFEKAVQPVYDKYESEFGDMIERIRAVE